MQRWMLASTLFLSACAWGPGEPFGSLETVLAWGVEVPSGRDAGNGFQRLDSDFQARFTAATFEVEEVRFVQPATATVNFDPANPPEGYTICHNGHCDSVTGELVPYEEVAAELAGGGGPTPLVTLEGGIEIDALTGGELCLEGCERVELARAEVNRIQVLLGAGTIEGVVRDPRATPRFEGELPFRMSWDEAAGDPHVTISAETGLELDNTEPPEIDARLTLAISGAILDGIEFEKLERPAGVLDLDLTANAAARERVRENLAALELDVAIERR